MQDYETGSGGLQSGGELIGWNVIWKQGANPGVQSLRRCCRRVGIGQDDDWDFGSKIGFDERFNNRFGRLAYTIDQEHICLRVGQLAAESIDCGGCAYNFDALRAQAILQRGTRDWRGGDEEDANHAAAALLQIR